MKTLLQSDTLSVMEKEEVVKIVAEAIAAHVKAEHDKKAPKKAKK